MSKSPARLAGLTSQKGEIASGFDADIVVWNPDETFTVDASKLAHRHHVTPYAGRELYGITQATYVGGRLSYHSFP
jgi:allantoinase